MSIRFLAQPKGCLRGSLNVPGDKSISHRAIMLASIAEGESHISGFLNGDDCLATMQAFRDMGVSITINADHSIVVQGVGLHGLMQPEHALDLGNSGTSMRLLTGLLAGQGFEVILRGDASLSSRPMMRVVTPLQKMGANINAAAGGFPPLHIKPSKQLQAIDYELPVASAQVKSALLFAGLYATGVQRIGEKKITRDHTERMLEAFSWPVRSHENTLSIEGGRTLLAQRIEIPGDISSAAFFIVGALIAQQSELTIKNVGVNPSRMGIINILRLMGANIVLKNERFMGGEPVADIVVYASDLKGIAVPEEQIPLAIDEVPILCIAAACAVGTTIISGAKELRVKESDRISAMAAGLRQTGVSVETREDGLLIQGSDDHAGAKFSGGTVNSFGDHRIAMSFAIAALRSEQEIVIEDCKNVDTSFPNFIATAADVGLNVVAHDVVDVA